MEISHSQFQTTDFNYGLIEGSQGLLYNKQQVQNSEFEPKNNIFTTSPISSDKKKKKPNNRFNISDSEYLDDTGYLQGAEEEGKEENLFAIQPQPNPVFEAMKKVKTVFGKIPVLNSVILKGKSIKLQKTLNNLNEINQNTDSIISSSMPFGEEERRYSEITKNLSDASNLIGQVKKEME
ncbi:hypothetical protein IKQ26_01600 [bacterium]|nr:hypothetical protein [bacterium]